MNLFGIRIELKTCGTFAIAPTNRAQVMNELDRLDVDVETTTTLKQARAALKKELIELAMPHVVDANLTTALRRKRLACASDVFPLGQDVVIPFHINNKNVGDLWWSFAPAP